MNIIKKINYLTIALFIVFLTLPTVFGLILPTHSNSAIENLRIAAKPKIPDNWRNIEQSIKDFEQYYADHFGFRWPLLFLHSKLKYFIHDSPLETALFGNKEGWIFYDSKSDGDVIGDYRNINQFSEKQLADIIKHLKQKQKWLANQSIEYLFVIAPSKHYVYPENLPKYIYRAQQQNLVLQLTQALDKHPEIHYINLNPVLLESKKSNQSQILYYKSDTHWNFYGTNIAQHAIAKKMAYLFIGMINPYLFKEDEFTEKSMVAGDLAQYMGLDQYFLEDKIQPKFDNCSDYAEENRLLFTTSCSGSRLNALVFRDSFFSGLQPYMSLYFNESTFIWEKMTFSRAQEYIQKSRPNIVIEEWVDRFLPRSLAPEYKY